MGVRNCEPLNMRIYADLGLQLGGAVVLKEMGGGRVLNRILIRVQVLSEMLHFQSIFSIEVIVIGLLNLWGTSN